MRSSDIGDWIDVVVTATGTGGANSATSNPTGIVTGPSSSGDPVVVAVGDIACPPGGGGSCQQGQTAAVAAQQHPNDVLVLGDNQYDGGLFSEYTGAGAYNATWGVFGCALCAATPIVHPVPGNHEYLDSVDGGPAGGYFRYFGSAIANPGGTPYGYYSFNVGAWHIIALNSNCSDSGCGDAITGYTTGAQNAWLQNDLANDHSACTLAMWHHPLFSSGWTPGSSNMQPLWTALYGAHADIVLNGHDHLYERYAQQDPSRTATTSGIREFVVGTGGESVNGLSNPQTNLQASYSQFGVLVLTLHAGSYDWAFKSTGGTVLDSGTGGCHGSAASSGLAAHIARARPAPLSEPRLTFDARPLHSSLTKATQAGLPVAIHCSQMCDTTIDASLNLNGRPRRIATYVETESQIPGPYVVIHLRLPAHQLHALTQAKLTLRFTAVDANQHHVVLTTTEQLNRR